MSLIIALYPIVEKVNKYYMYMKTLTKKLILILILVELSLVGIAQVNCPTAGKEGIKVINKRYFKWFSFLLQDTCNHSNRFDNDFFHYKKGQLTFNNNYCQILQADTLLLIKIEEWCRDSLRVNVAHRIKELADKNKSLEKKLEKFYSSVNRYRQIRLYMSYIDDADNLCVLVQYITKKQLEQNPFYIKQFNLIALGRDYKKDPLLYLKLCIEKSGVITLL